MRAIEYAFRQGSASLWRSRGSSAFAVLAIMLAPRVVQGDDKKPKPSVSIRASPGAGFSPLRVVLTAELKGGTNDYEEFYCPSVEWTWGDDTKTETSADCEPYEAGKSEIQRRYTTSKTFHTAGEYRVEFRLKQKNKVVGSGSVTVQVRPGVRDGGGQ